jgi:hypothetical protein
MNVQITNRNHERAGVLLSALFITAAIAIGIASYMLLVRAQYVSVARSQAWNAALEVAEGGVEEALAQLNPGATATTMSVNRSANGWGSASGGNYGPVSRALTGNGSYAVVFTDTTFPVIYSTGYVTLPDISATLTRVVRVATTNVPLFNVSMAARTNINMNGNGLTANSFDSSNTNKSTNGRFDSSKTGTNGDVAVLYGTLDIGNHNIAGDVFLGPTASYNGNASQVSGNIYSDFSSDFPSVALPPDVGTWMTLAAPLLPTPVNVNGTLTLYNYVFNSSGNYIIPNMNGTIYVNTNARVKLEILSGGTDGVLVNSSGTNAGNLTIYVAAASFTIGGNGSVDGGKAANLAYYGLPSNTIITLNGNAGFTGTIYAPSAALTLNGGGSSDYDFVGSCIANSLTTNGHFMFHFDEALLKSPASRGYLAVSWREL